MKIYDMESTRQQKLGRMLQKELAQLLQFEIKEYTFGTMVSVTVVRVSPDLSVAKVYLSIFGTDDKDKVVNNLREHQGEVRYHLGKMVKGQMRKLPELHFFLDDSLDYLDHIETLLKS